VTQPSQLAVAIGLDIGTSGARAVALTATGDIAGFASSPFVDLSETRQPQAWWARTKECMTNLAAQTDLTSVQGIAVDGTSGTVLAVDRNGQPVGDVLMYNDVCPDTQTVKQIASFAPGDSPALGASSGLAKAIYLSRMPGASNVIHQADWILMQLGFAEPVSDENNALKSGYDLVNETWPKWIEEAGMNRELLPPVKRAGEPVGKMAGFASNLGLPSSCNFHAGTTDGCASFLATGASKIGDGVTALGSTIVLKLASDHPINAPEFGIYAHRILSFWLIGGASNSGGAIIRALIGDDRLDELTALIRPEQPTGLGYYPLLKPGERFPVNDPAFLPRLEPRPKDDAIFFQAILEGMTEIERGGYERLGALGAPSLKTMRTVGGGARNTAWSQMRQSALGVEFLAAKSVEASVGTASLVLAAIERRR
jgi:D-ribulokinase